MTRNTTKYSAAGMTAAIALTISVHAQEPAPPLNFVLWNSGPGQSFDNQLWVEALGPLSYTNDYIALITTDGARIPEVMEAARARTPREPVVVLSTVQIATEDEASFAETVAAIDRDIADGVTFAGAVTLLDQPLCRVLRLPLGPTDYAPVALVLTGQKRDQMITCYREVAAQQFRRARGYDLDADGNQVAAVDETAEFAQSQMPAAYSLGWKFIDTTDPDRQARRETNVFAPNEEILFETSLDYIRKEKAGYPGASYRIRLDAEVRDPDGTVLGRIDNLYLYEGVMRHRVPVDADYFRNWMTSGLSLPDPGEYQIAYIFTDLNAPDNKRVPVEVLTEVTIQSE